MDATGERALAADGAGVNAGWLTGCAPGVTPDGGGLIAGWLAGGAWLIGPGERDGAFVVDAARTGGLPPGRRDAPAGRDLIPGQTSFTDADAPAGVAPETEEEDAHRGRRFEPAEDARRAAEEMTDGNQGDGDRDAGWRVAGSGLIHGASEVRAPARPYGSVSARVAWFGVCPSVRIACG